MFKKNAEEMTEEELREELAEIRASRAGKGREKRAQSRERRISDGAKTNRSRKRAKEVEDAEFV